MDKNKMRDSKRIKKKKKKTNKHFLCDYAFRKMNYLRHYFSYK